MHRRSRVLLSLAVVLTTIPIALANAAPSANAQTPEAKALVDLVCPVSATAKFTPGIGLLSQTQQLAGAVQGGTVSSPATPCTSLTGVPYQGFTMDLQGTGNMTCGVAALGGGISGKADVTWDNGDKSTAEWSVTTVAMAPVPDVTETKGALSGAKIVVAGAPTGLTGNCLLNPVTKAGFAGVAEFVNLGG